MCKQTNGIPKIMLRDGIPVWWVPVEQMVVYCTNLRNGCAKVGEPMNLGRLLTGIALRQIDVPAAETNLRSLDHIRV